MTNIRREQIVLHDATILLVRPEDDTGLAVHFACGAVEGFACPWIALALLLHDLSRHASGKTASGRALSVGALRRAVLMDDLVPEKSRGAFGRIGQERLFFRTGPG